jgi:hypothetical protein
MSGKTIEQMLAEKEALEKAIADKAKEEKKEAIAKVKSLIKNYKITSGDIRGVLMVKYDKSGKGVKAIISNK